jgi:hypothetical protein
MVETVHAACDSGAEPAGGELLGSPVRLTAMGRTRVFAGVLALLLLVAGCTTNHHAAGSHLCRASGQPPPAPGDAAGVLMLPASAARLSVTIDVEAANGSRHRCVIPGSPTSGDGTVRLRVGDETTYIANDPPALTLAARKIVSISRWYRFGSRYDATGTSSISGHRSPRSPSTLASNRLATESKDVAVIWLDLPRPSGSFEY